MLLPAAVSANTVRPVAEAVGSAAAAGLNTSAFAESVAAAYATGGVPAQAMTAAFTKAATTGGCNGTTRALSGEHAVHSCLWMGLQCKVYQALQQLPWHG
jgi:hypothetical protein